MPTIVRFEDIEAWQTARQLTHLVYDLSRQNEFAKDFGLRDQMRRAAISIMSNIAEGFESKTQVMFQEYLGRAKASAGELRAQTYIAKDTGYLKDQEFTRVYDLCEKCSRQLSRFIQYLSKQPNSIREEGIDYNV